MVLEGGNIFAYMMNMVPQMTLINSEPGIKTKCVESDNNGISQYLSILKEYDDNNMESQKYGVDCFLV